MNSLQKKQVVVTGGSRGLGLGIVEALVAQGASVTVVARNAERLKEVGDRLGVNTISGDVTDENLAKKVLHDVRPSVLILNAGETPAMAPLHELTWEEFNGVWNADVRASFYWLQQVLRMPLAKGTRVIIGSSGAGIGGSPNSGSYAGAKRMQMFLAAYANDAASRLDLNIRFQAIAPMQIIGDTDLGRNAAQHYAKKKGVSVDENLAGFGAPLPPKKLGEYVVSILTDPQYEKGTLFGVKGDAGIISLDK